MTSNASKADEDGSNCSSQAGLASVHRRQFACPIAFPVVVPVQFYFVITRDKGPVRIFRPV
jgi:hypothetical protein